MFAFRGWFLASLILLFALVVILSSLPSFLAITLPFVEVALKEISETMPSIESFELQRKRLFSTTTTNKQINDLRRSGKYFNFTSIRCCFKARFIHKRLFNDRDRIISKTHCCLVQILSLWFYLAQVSPKSRGYNLWKALQLLRNFKICNENFVVQMFFWWSQQIFSKIITLTDRQLRYWMRRKCTTLMWTTWWNSKEADEIETISSWKSHAPFIAVISAVTRLLATGFCAGSRQWLRSSSLSNDKFIALFEGPTKNRLNPRFSSAAYPITKTESCVCITTKFNNCIGTNISMKKKVFLHFFFRIYPGRKETACC